jgi:ABC-type transport system substrate-binding protein
MIGQKLSDRYEIVSELGRGGMGIVYRATDPVLSRDVAVKVVAPELLTPETEQRFQTEAKVVAQMDHPSIVTIYDFGRHEGSLYFVMPLVEGESLRHHLRNEPLKLGTVVDLGIEVADALDYSHDRGVVHRDIKPENVMVTLESGGGVRIRIMDFGLARGTNVSSLTKTGMLVGTMSYISPEQVMSGSIDGRSDIYSLGCVLYECVLNEVPFTGEMQSVLYRVVHELPQSPRDFGADIDQELEDVILTCLAKDPADRPQKAGELARSLRRYRAKLHDSQRLQSIMMTQTMQAPRPQLSPLIGREEEFKELQKRLNAAIQGKCQFVALSGEPGVGKTRLLDELETLAGARNIPVLHGRFVEQHGEFPYHGFCEAIQEFYQRKERGSSPDALPDLTDLAADLISLFPMLSEIEPIRSAASGASQLAEAGTARTPENRTQVFELLAKTLTQLAGGKPIVMILEDLHGAEASIEALQYIVRRLGPTSTLLVGTYQSTEVDKRHPLSEMLEGFQGDRRFSSLVLGPFSPSEHREFLSTLTGGTEIVDDLAAKLFDATEGNPFFTKELVRSLLDAGSISQGETGSWELSGGMEISSEALPATIQQAVERRIGRLPEDMRRILSVASVMGKSFEFDDLEALAGADEELEDAVDAFIQAGLLEEERQSRGDRLTFSSAVVREVLYSELSRRKRRSLHRKFATLLEKRQRGRLERVYPQLLYHFSEGDVPDKTVEYGLLHARKSLDSFSPEEAMRSAKMALEFLDEDWEGDATLEGEARLLLATGHRMTSDTEGALKEFRSVVKVFEREGQTDRVIEALLAAAQTAWQTRRTDETRRWVERGMEVSRAAGKNESLAEFLSLAATVANLHGEYVKGSEYLAEAESLLAQSEEAEVKDQMPQGGTLVAALANPLAATIPVNMQLTEEYEAFANVFETLLTTDQEGHLQAHLCESWEVEDDGRTFRLVLRPEVRFQDGEPLTARGVKASIETAIRQATADLPAAFAAIKGRSEVAAGKAEEVAGIEALSDHELVIRLDDQLPIYPAMLTDRRTAITRPAADDGQEGNPVIGTGPFRIRSHQPEKLVLERDEDYWLGELPNIEALEFKACPNSAAIASGFRAGDFDLARDLVLEDLEEILHDPRFHDNLVEKPQKFVYFVLFNTQEGAITSNPNLRRALSGVVRARDLVWQTLGRFAEPAVSMIPPGILGHDAGRRPFSLTIEEARELVAAAGIDGKTTLKAAVHPLLRDRYSSLLDGLLASWAELGVEIETVTTEVESYLEAMHSNAGIDVLIGRWRPDFNDPDDCTHSLFESTRGMFRSYFASAKTDEVLEAARRESKPVGREALYRKFEDLILEEHAFSPLFHDVGYRIVGSKVKGLELLGTPPYVNYSALGKLETSTASAITRRGGGGVVQIPISGRVQRLDPALGTLVEEAESLAPIYETLVRDLGQARMEPWLAESLTVEEGGKRYKFVLRDGVTFHDGRRLSARDVRFSFERLLKAEESDGRWLLNPIAGAQAVLDGEARALAGFHIHSPREFSIELDRPVSFFPLLLATPNAAIVPEGTGVIGNSLEEGAVGTGPYRVARFEPGVQLELERHSSHWRKGYPKADRLVYSFGLAPDKILSEFRAGRFSIASDLYPADVEAMRLDPQFAAGYREMPRLSSYFAAFNIHSGPLQDAALRQKLVRAVDVAGFVKQTLGNLAIPAKGLIPPGLLGYESSRPGSGVMPRVAGDQGSAAPELEVTAAVHPVFEGEYASFAEEVTKAFHRVGVQIKPVTESIADYMEAQQKGSVDVIVGRWIADYPDADTFAGVLNTKDGFIGRMCGSPELDRLVEAGRTESDPDARHAIYRKIEDTVTGEAMILPLFHEQVYRFARPEVEGLSLSYWMPTVSYESLGIRETARAAAI